MGNSSRAHHRRHRHSVPVYGQCTNEEFPGRGSWVSHRVIGKVSSADSSRSRVYGFPLRAGHCKSPFRFRWRVRPARLLVMTARSHDSDPHVTEALANAVTHGLGLAASIIALPLLLPDAS